MYTKSQIIEEADFLIARRCTIREAAEYCSVSKSQLHNHLTSILMVVDVKKFRKVRRILDKNKKERAMRGGAVTKKKYELLKMKK